MKIKHLDYFVVLIVSLLLILGLSFLATISAPASMNRFGTTNHYWIHQFIYGILPGLFLCLVAFIVPLSFTKKMGPLLMLGNIIALVLVFLPALGVSFWGASRWLSIGGISFQPSEFIKIFSIIYLASWLRNRLQPTNRMLPTANSSGRRGLTKIFIPFCVFLMVIGLIFFFQKDATTLFIVGATSIAIYFASGVPKWQVLLIIFMTILVFALLIVQEPYRFSRITTMFNPNDDPQGKGFQITQALIAVGSGGLGGKGLGMSSQKFGSLPQSMSDSTFAVYAEETGFVGCSILISLFLMLLWAGFAIARRADDKFYQLVALGVTFWILFQGFVNISSMIGLFPISGVPLPFISYGGSHLIAELIGIGLLLNIARHSKD